MTTAELTQDYKDAVIDYFTHLLFGELHAAEVIGCFTRHAPTPEEKARIATFVAEEVGHYQLHCQVIEHMGGKEALDEAHRKVAENKMWALTDFMIGQLEDDYTQFIVAMPLLGDVGGVWSFSEVMELTPDPFVHEVCDRVVREEEGHAQLGRDVVKRLVGEPGGLERVQAAVDKWLPINLSFSGGRKSKRNEWHVKAGVRKTLNMEHRQLRLDYAKKILEPLGIEVKEPESTDLEYYSDLIRKAVQSTQPVDIEVS